LITSGKFFACGLRAFLLCSALASAQTTSPKDAGVPAASQASEPSESTPAFHASSRLVVVNAVVADRDGNPMSGLDRDDFQLLEDGKTQQLQVFEPHVPAKQPTAIPDVRLAPKAYTNSAKQVPGSAVNVA